MLSNNHHQRYQEFAAALEQLQQLPAATQLDLTKLRQRFTEVQQFFQQQILGLDASETNLNEPRVRSYQTEISKQLQLLAMDVLFLQAARQQQTKQDRQQQFRDRLQTLQSYCDAIRQLN